MQKQMADYISIGRTPWACMPTARHADFVALSLIGDEIELMMSADPQSALSWAGYIVRYASEITGRPIEDCLKEVHKTADRNRELDVVVEIAA